MNNQEIIALNERYLFPTYARAPFALLRGDGCRVWDADGKEYLDFFSSTVVTSLGHNHPALTAAIVEQAKKILHVSNLHHSEPQALLAQWLCENSFADRVFLCNSGAEANEAAIKLARKFGADFGDGRFEIVTALGSFHGRTIATIAATGQEKVRRGFQPLPGGFRYAAFGDVEALAKAITPQTIAIMLEPVQGEGGIVVPPPAYLKDVRALCDERELLLILDEVQTGLGRVGAMFGYELSGITPDIVTLAKGLGSGVPIGAMLSTERVAAAFSLGTHGSTFGGNALSCAAALTVCRTVGDGGVLKNCQAQASYLMQKLRELQQRCPRIKDVRGAGLLIGVELDGPGGAVVETCRDLGLIINCTAEKVLRLTPPFILTSADVDHALAILEKALLS